MMAVTCMPFNLRHYNHADGGILKDYLYIDLIPEFSVWGDFFVGNTTADRAREQGRALTVEQCLKALRFVRSVVIAKEGEVEIDAPRQKNTYYKSPGPEIKRKAVDCPCLMAILDYLDDGDETDLMGAVDMLIDAGKFDPE